MEAQIRSIADRLTAAEIVDALEITSDELLDWIVDEVLIRPEYRSNLKDLLEEYAEDF